MKFSARVLALCCAMALATPVFADGQRLETRYFPGPNLELNGRWLETNPRLGMDPARLNSFVAQSTFTELQITIPPAYVGKNVSIHVFVPLMVQGMQQASGMEVEWRTQGVLLAGKMRPGERALLYRGPVTSALLRDRIMYSFIIDARHVNGPIRFEPEYEISEK